MAQAVPWLQEDSGDDSSEATPKSKPKEKSPTALPMASRRAGEANLNLAVVTLLDQAVPPGTQFTALLANPATIRSASGEPVAVPPAAAASPKPLLDAPAAAAAPLIDSPDAGAKPQEDSEESPQANLEATLLESAPAPLPTLDASEYSPAPFSDERDHASKEIPASASDAPPLQPRELPSKDPAPPVPNAVPAVQRAPEVQPPIPPASAGPAPQPDSPPEAPPVRTSSSPQRVEGLATRSGDVAEPPHRLPPAVDRPETTNGPAGDFGVMLHGEKPPEHPAEADRPQPDQAARLKSEHTGDRGARLPPTAETREVERPAAPPDNFTMPSNPAVEIIARPAVESHATAPALPTAWVQLDSVSSPVDAFDPQPPKAPLTGVELEAGALLDAGRGEVSVRVAETAAGFEVRVTAADPTVRDTLLGDLQHLAGRVESQGLGTVFAATPADGSFPDSSPNGRRTVIPEERKVRSRRANTPSFDVIAEATNGASEASY